MSIIGLWIDNINTKRMNDLIKDKYLKVSNEILLNINNEKKIDNIITKNNLNKIQNELTKEREVLYRTEHTFGFISIEKESFDDEFVILIKYLDDLYILKTKDEQNLNDKIILNSLVFLDIFVLLLIFLFILKLLFPIKNITEVIRSFSEGNLSKRINIKSNDEIGILANSFNTMATSLEELINTREVLLRDIGHELRTPIAKGKFAIEKIDDFSQKELLKKIFNDLEMLTSELIELEKLNSNRLTITKFSSQTLILDALSKLYIEDDSKIKVVINDDFKINGDLQYLSMAVKNLIDNALKYSSHFPITIKAKNNEISVINSGEKLNKKLNHYVKPFIQELPQRDGFGLGLSIVDKIIKKHNFILKYEYLNGENIFSIITT